jgi:hypothetical protein
VPWIANGALSIDGTRHRLGGPQRMRSTKVDEHPTSARLRLGGEGVKLDATIEAAPEHMVVWRYADPEGPEHHSAHSSIADLRIDVDTGDGGTMQLVATKAATYEFGMRETDHGLPVQPYDDGRL